MSYEHVDFDRVVRFDNRMLGSIGSTPHTNTGPVQSVADGRPQLSVVPVPTELEPAIDEDEQWQERALCAQTDPEAFFPDEGGPPGKPSASTGCAMSPTSAWRPTHWSAMSVSASGAGTPSANADR
jgi:hypothetical protein